MQYAQLRRIQLPHPVLYIFFFFKENNTYELHNYFKSPESYHNSKALYSTTQNGTLKYDPEFHASVIYIKLRTNKNILLRSFMEGKVN